MAEKSSKHIENLIKDKVYAVCLVDGETVSGEQAYAYVAVPMAKLESFAVAQQSDNFIPSDFGAIIESNMGSPSKEVKQRMESEYGFNHDEVITFPDNQ